MFHLSKNDFGHFQPYAEKALTSVGAGSDPRVLPMLLACLGRGDSRTKLVETLRSKMDVSKAEKVADKIADALEAFRASNASKKRKDDSSTPAGNGDAKHPRLSVDPGQQGSGMSDEMIKRMMDSAKQEVLRKAALMSSGGPVVSKPPEQTPVQTVKPGSETSALTAEAAEKAKKAAELQARIQERFSSNPAIAAALQKLQQTLPGIEPGSGQPGSEKPSGRIILDAQGRAVNASTGEVIEMPHHVPTLKANIRAQKRQHFQTVIAETQQQAKHQAAEEATSSSFFDSRVALPKMATSRRGRQLKFHEQGKFVKLAHSIRLKRQLERLQTEIAQSARKTGIASVAKLAIAQPRIDATTAATPAQVPALEWWDATILRHDTYDGLPEEITSQQFEGITNLVEHPIQAQAPDVKPGQMTKIPLFLTKTERKKLRRQNRRAIQQEEQEKVRLGLLPPPEPKVKISNLMRVLGTDAVADPTKIEQRVRQQMMKRQKEHEAANKARMLTSDQKREKRAKKLQDQTAVDMNVAVYRVRDLSNPSKKFKVETNAKQLLMTGIVCLSKDCNVVVVEGNAKQQKKFRQLMLNRIKWSEDPVREWAAGIGKNKTVVADGSGSANNPGEMNACELVWEGTAKKRAFGDVLFKICQTETAAREQFRRHNVEQYWDLAYSTSVLSEAFTK